MRDSACGGSVSCRIRQQDGGFVSGDEATIRVCGGVCEGVESSRVLHQTSDIPEALLRESDVFFSGEEGFSVLAEGLMDVHSGSVVSSDGLGHEGCGLSVGVGDVSDDVLEEL